MAATAQLQSPRKPLILPRHPRRRSPASLPDKLLHLLHKRTTATELLSTFSPISACAATECSQLETLAVHLSASDFRKADEETRRLLIDLAGDAARQRGYIYFSEIQFIPASDLSAIDALWIGASGGRFGYSVQRRVWERKAGRDFTRFFIQVGWMKKMETVVEQYNYKAFPEEFMWEIADHTPEGHLPLTNALRGTQLLASILTHPAFDNYSGGGDGSEGERKQEGSEVGSDGVRKEKTSPLVMEAGSFKPDYSF